MPSKRRELSYLLGSSYHRLSWIEWGDPRAPAVVCVHGLTRNAHDFDRLAETLSATHRVICPDLPGRGASEWLPEPALYAPPTYVQALSHLLAGIDGPVDWVGTSLGGICGMLIAAAPGQPIARMVLNDIGPFIPKRSLERLRAQLAGHPADFADIAEAEARLRVVYAPFGVPTDADWRTLTEHSVRRTPDGRYKLSYDPTIARAFDAGPIEDVDLWPVWDRVKIPTLVIRGADSDLLEAETLARMARSGAASHVVEGAGHAPALLDQPTIAVVADFLTHSP